MSLKVIAKLREGQGIFACGKEVSFSSTYAVNEKGGMTDKEFEKVMINIRHLYSDDFRKESCTESR